MILKPIKIPKYLDKIFTILSLIICFNWLADKLCPDQVNYIPLLIGMFFTWIAFFLWDSKKCLCNIALVIGFTIISSWIVDKFYPSQENNWPMMLGYLCSCLIYLSQDFQGSECPSQKT